MKVWKKFLLCLSFLLVGLILLTFTTGDRLPLFNFLKKNNKASLFFQQAPRLIVQTPFVDLPKSLLQQAPKSIKQSPLVPKDCMEEQFQTNWRGSSTNTSLSSQHCDLCEIFQGRYYNVTKQCKYYHPNTVHYIKYSGKSNPVLKFKEFISIVSVDKFYKPDKIVIHADNVHLSGPYWDRISKTISTPIEVRPTE